MTSVLHYWGRPGLSIQLKSSMGLPHPYPRSFDSAQDFGSGLDLSLP